MAVFFPMLCFWIGIVAKDGSNHEVDTSEHGRWTESFSLEECDFSPTGRNAYFILEPGYQLHLEGIEEGDTVKLTITVLNEKERIGNVETRVVEEKETVNGKVIEVSRNFFALCTQTSSLFYFGEDVDIYEGGEVVSHGGAWRADSGEAKAGVMMPGIILLGARYYQEIAPGVAMDRAEIMSCDETLETPAGMFENCLEIEETTPLEPENREYKVYAPGIGLIKDGALLLTKYGFTDR